MNEIHGRDLDLNLLRVFVVTADSGTVTAAAARLYLTQPAISAALKRLATSVGAPLFARAGRGLVLTTRGKLLLARARPLLESLVNAALSPAEFDPGTSERTIRIGLSDSNEAWLLPPLLRALEREAPRMRLSVLPVQFRTVGRALGSAEVDLAVTVADELPAGTHRRALFTGTYVALYDPRHVRMPRSLGVSEYLAYDHVIVSYNGDLRGVVEDALGVERRVRVAVPTFHSVGGLVDGSSLVATVPAMVARVIRESRPHLRTSALPVSLPGTPMEMFWTSAVDDDPAIRFVQQHIVRIAAEVSKATSRWGAKPRVISASPRRTRGAQIVR